MPLYILWKHKSKKKSGVENIFPVKVAIVQPITKEKPLWHIL